MFSKKNRIQFLIHILTSKSTTEARREKLSCTETCPDNLQSYRIIS